MERDRAHVKDGPNGERLKGWKEISAFLRVHPRTAQRWLDRGLAVPVHRIQTAHSSIVYAVRSELDVWMQSDEGRNARDQAEGIEGSMFMEHHEDDRGDQRAQPVPRPEPVASSDASVARSHPRPGGFGQKGRLARVLILTALVLLVIASVALYRNWATSPRPAARGPRPTEQLRLVFSNGSSVRVGLFAGTHATIGVPGRTVLLALQPTGHDMLLNVSQVDDSNGAISAASTIGLKRGQAVRVGHTGIESVEWLASTQ